MVSPRDGCVVGVHHAVNEAEEHPLGNQVCLPADYALEEGTVRPLPVYDLRIMPSNRIVGERARCFGIAPRGEILERAHADVASGYPGQHRSR